MKKITLFFLCIILTLSFGSCTNKKYTIVTVYQKTPFGGYTQLYLLDTETGNIKIIPDEVDDKPYFDNAKNKWVKQN